jgi:hypothetical protein
VLGQGLSFFVCNLYNIYSPVNFSLLLQHQASSLFEPPKRKKKINKKNKKIVLLLLRVKKINFKILSFFC